MHRLAFTTHPAATPDEARDRPAHSEQPKVTACHSNKTMRTTAPIRLQLTVRVIGPLVPIYQWTGRAWIVTGWTSEEIVRAA